MTDQNDKLKFVFFGSPKFAVIVLEILKKDGIVPSLIVTSEDKPKGRKMIVTPPPAKIWAIQNNISFFQPTTLRAIEATNKLMENSFDLFIVASYGKIIPKEILDIPKLGTLNIHPSLLPKWRGASPIQATIINDDIAGVSIMLLDEEMDHGPIVAQKEIKIEKDNWPPYFENLEKILAEEGAKLLRETLKKWVSGDIKPIPQDHQKAVFCSKIKKEDTYIDLSEESGEKAYQNFKKIRAFNGNLGTYSNFVHKRTDKNIRVKIIEADFDCGKIILKKVVPEGRKEMSWEDFKRGYLS